MKTFNIDKLGYNNLIFRNKTDNSLIQIKNYDLAIWEKPAISLSFTNNLLLDNFKKFNNKSLKNCFDSIINTFYSNIMVDNDDIENFHSFIYNLAINKVDFIETIGKWEYNNKVFIEYGFIIRNWGQLSNKLKNYILSSLKKDFKQKSIYLLHEKEELYL